MTGDISGFTKFYRAAIISRSRKREWLALGFSSAGLDVARVIFQFRAFQHADMTPSIFGVARRICRSRALYSLLAHAEDATDGR